MAIIENQLPTAGEASTTGKIRWVAAGGASQNMPYGTLAYHMLATYTMTLLGTNQSVRSAISELQYASTIRASDSDSNTTTVQAMLNLCGITDAELTALETALGIS